MDSWIILVFNATALLPSWDFVWNSDTGNKNHQAMRFHHFWGCGILGRRHSVVAVGSFRSRRLALSSVRGFFQRCGWTGSPCPGAVARHGGGQKRPGGPGAGFRKKALKAGNFNHSSEKIHKSISENIHVKGHKNSMQKMPETTRFGMGWMMFHQ